jgi:hypothetical protein
LLISNIIIIRTKKHNLNYTKTLAIIVGMLAIAVEMIGTIVIPGYLQEVKAATKTHSLSTSMSTSCNGATDKPCQTIVCKNDKPCRNLDSNSDQTDFTTACEDNKACRNLVDSNSSQPQQTENTTAAAQPQQQQPDSSSSSDDDEMTPFPQTPPIPQIPNYSDYGFD